MRAIPGLLGALALALTASSGAAQVSTPLTELAPPSDSAYVFQALAEGVQIYDCRARADAPTTFEWAFRAPEAVLLNERGERIGHHYAGPTWEGNDGSKVVGQVRTQVDAPGGGAIPWLLLQARTNEGSGIFGAVTFIQRIDTVGGRAPSTPCTAAENGQERRVEYTATYSYYIGGYVAGAESMPPR